MDSQKLPQEYSRKMSAPVVEDLDEFFAEEARDNVLEDRLPEIGSQCAFGACSCAPPRNPCSSVLLSQAKH